MPSTITPSSSTDPNARIARSGGAGAARSSNSAALEPPAPLAQPDGAAATHYRSGARRANSGYRRIPTSSPAVARTSAPARVVHFDPARFNRAKFYDGVRAGPFPGRLSPGQVGGLETILNEWERRGMTDLRWLAYMLATTFHETDQKMQPIEEYGRGRRKTYGRIDPETGKAYFGRGYVQLTWRANYETMGRLLGLDLVRHPELALQPDVATQIMFEGMTRGLSRRGDFTGKSLEHYFTDQKSDWRNARRIINGTDRADLIAGYAKQLFQDLVAAQS
jgi:putative chitinase